MYVTKRNKNIKEKKNNCTNLLREEKQQQDLFKDYFNHIGALAGQEERIWRCE